MMWRYDAVAASRDAFMRNVMEPIDMSRWIIRAAVAVVVSLMTMPVWAGQATAPVSVDFDAAMQGLRFDPLTVDANLDATGQGNGMLDADELALVSALLASPSLNLPGRGGVDAGAVRAAFAQARTSVHSDLKALLSPYPTAVDVAAGYVMLGKGSYDAYNAMSTGLGAPLNGDYSQALALSRYLAFDGDADGDGVSNLDEYRATIAQGRAAFVKAALDPTVRPLRAGTTTLTAAPAVAAPAAASRKTLGVVLYPGFEVLDVFGPLEMWSYVPDFKVVLVAEKAGPVRSAQGVDVHAEFSFTTAPALDIMMVPGGVGTRAELLNPVFLEYLRTQDRHTQVTTSVCTGSALLAKAGLLTGHKATSNKSFFSLAVDQDPRVDWVIKARWVDDGKYVTSSGVSAGTDMALGLVMKLYGKERAERLARSLEYEWPADPSVDPFALSELPRSGSR